MRNLNTTVSASTKKFHQRHKGSRANVSIGTVVEITSGLMAGSIGSLIAVGRNGYCEVMVNGVRWPSTMQTIQKASRNNLRGGK